MTTEVDKKGKWRGCLIVCGVLLLGPVLIVFVVVLGGSCRDCNASRRREQIALQSAESALARAEKSTNPCENLIDVIGSVRHATWTSSDTSTAMNKRLRAVTTRCRDKICQDLADGFVGDIPNERGVSVARDIQNLQSRLSFDESCSKRIKIATEYMKAHDEVAEVTKLFSENQFAKGAETITELRGRSDPLVGIVLVDNDANKLLFECVAKANRLADREFESENYYRAMAHYEGALACDDGLPEDRAMGRSERQKTERRMKRAERANKRAEAAEERRDARCQARGIALLRCEEQCDIRADRMDTNSPNSYFWYERCVDRCGKMPANCR